jgi:choline dehydrogenase
MHSHAMKVLLDENKRAIGVRFKRDGKVQNVYARREVILSSGAINSPHLLMLTGIGPASHLKEMGVPLVKVKAMKVECLRRVLKCIFFYYRIRQ